MQCDRLVTLSSVRWSEGGASEQAKVKRLKPNSIPLSFAPQQPFGVVGQLVRSLPSFRCVDPRLANHDPARRGPLRRGLAHHRLARAQQPRMVSTGDHRAGAPRGGGHRLHPELPGGRIQVERSMTVGALVPFIGVPQFLPTVQTLTEELDRAGYQLILGQTATTTRAKQRCSTHDRPSRRRHRRRGPAPERRPQRSACAARQFRSSRRGT